MVFGVLKSRLGEKLIAIHETIWSSVSGVVDGLTPIERHDAMNSLLGSWRNPKESDSWNSTDKCLQADSLEERMNCWSKKGN